MSSAGRHRALPPLWTTRQRLAIGVLRCRIEGRRAVRILRYQTTPKRLVAAAAISLAVAGAAERGKACPEVGVESTEPSTCEQPAPVVAAPQSWPTAAIAKTTMVAARQTPPAHRPAPRQPAPPAAEVMTSTVETIPALVTGDLIPSVVQLLPDELIIEVLRLQL